MVQKESLRDGVNDSPILCPHCKRPIVNRLVDYCQYCTRDLPEELCLSPEQKRNLISEHEKWRKELREKSKRRPPKKPLGGGSEGGCGGVCGGLCGGDV